ncbi:T9SS type A sorting domain-containing protein [Carboxylicivirga sediminis]|uniref:T9SS type A sorting domain-containing protein n=1 Tax=Carboxylicivirga sediminis TaxID=2006564 RepID=A0A941IXW7_9BACT|nr:DNRLRE domain-containing protein [Carboxylicivirga sediminis]MBR8536385.1 T9SS type A sorting domain-containing protein [Carboxylicivirga sediminis]
MRTILLLALLFMGSYVSAQNIMIYQPGPGANNGSDEGGLTGGKDTWVNRYSPGDNKGGLDHVLTSPRSSCNESDYKGYFKFDVSTLPEEVNAVYFGVTHIEHTSYCYSNCTADFYFYLCTSDWDEMSLVQNNLPTEESTAFFGPLAISYPNNLGVQEYDITSAYNYWKENPELNFGFVVYSPTTGCNNASVYFGVKSSDDAVEANRPYLKIDYSGSTAVHDLAKATTVGPNPFTDFINLPAAGVVNCYLTNLNGQKMDVGYSQGVKQLFTAHLPRGVYLLHLELEGQSITHKLIKR